MKPTDRQMIEACARAMGYTVVPPPPMFEEQDHVWVTMPGTKVPVIYNPLKYPDAAWRLAVRLMMEVDFFSMTAEIAHDGRTTHKGMSDDSANRAVVECAYLWQVDKDAKEKKRV